MSAGSRGGDVGTIITSVPDLPPEWKRAARVTVARNALDAADCRELLGMLGLITEESA